MKTNQFIFREQRTSFEQSHITDFYFMNNGKPAFIMGFQKTSPQSVRKIIRTLLNLRAANYLYAAICEERGTVKQTVKELFENKTNDGFHISQIIYDAEAISHFEEDNFVDLIFTLRKGFEAKYYNYRFYDYSAYQEAEKFLIPQTSDLVVNTKYDDKFPKSTIIIKELKEE